MQNICNQSLRGAFCGFAPVSAKNAPRKWMAATEATTRESLPLDRRSFERRFSFFDSELRIAISVKLSANFGSFFVVAFSMV
jgi:hypothetical protein